MPALTRRFLPLRLPTRLALLCAFALAAPAALAATDTPTPADMQGLWCGQGMLRDFSLEIHQQQQEATAMLSRGERHRELRGQVEGHRLRTEGKGAGLVLESQGDELRVVQGEGVLALARGMSFRRTPAPRCEG